MAIEALSELASNLGDAQQTVKSASSRSICLKRGPNHNVTEVWELTRFVAVTSEGEKEGGVANKDHVMLQTPINSVL
jgi:hypothetical protein